MFINPIARHSLSSSAKQSSTMQDVVFIEGLTVNAVIGVFEWERCITQPLLIDIAMMCDISQAAKSDDVADAINYKAVCDDVSAWCQQRQAKLLENLAQYLAEQLLANYACHTVTLKVAKPTAITQANAVGVQITRSKDLNNDAFDSNDEPDNNDNNNTLNDESCTI